MSARRILFLAKLFPWPLNFGARQRVFHLARGISSAHDVSVIALDEPRSEGEVSAFLQASGCREAEVVSAGQPAAHMGARRSLVQAVGVKVQSLDERLRSPLPRFVHDVWSSSLLRRLEALQRSHHFDLVYATQSWMGEHARAAGFDRIVVDVDDLISAMSTKRVTQSRWSRRYLIDRFDASKDARYERALPRRFEHVVIAKADDLASFRPSDRKRISIIPNGITVPPRALDEARDSSRLLFVGTLGYGPNIEAIRWLATAIMPLVWKSRPDVHLTVAGFGSGRHLADACADPRIDLQESPPDLTPLYAGAAVVLAPIRSGGGTRIKILEALALGRAMVCTEFAAEGLGLRGGVDVQFADTPEDIAARTVALLEDPARREALAASGRALVAERFDWAIIERSLPPFIAGLDDLARR